MPILPITDDHGSLKPEAPFICWAAMVFPDDAEERERMAWRTLVGALLDDATAAGDALIELEPDDLVELLASAHVDRMPEVLRTRIAGGQVAGGILQHLVAFAAHVPEHASIHKAVHVICHQLKEADAKTRRKVPASRTWVRTAWSTYKCVSHLWAAFHCFGELAGEAGMPDLHIIEASPESLFDFLAIAEWFRQQGESILPHPQVTPTLDPGLTWKVPEELALPEVELTVQAPLQATLEILRQYRAPKPRAAG